MSDLWRLDVGAIDLATGVGTSAWECLSLNLVPDVSQMLTAGILFAINAGGILFPAIPPRDGATGESAMLVHCGGVNPVNTLTGRPSRCFYISSNNNTWTIHAQLPSIASQNWQYVGTNHAGHDTVLSDGAVRTLIFGGELPLEMIKRTYISVASTTLGTGEVSQVFPVTRPIPPINSDALFLQQSSIAPQSVLVVPGVNSCLHTAPCYVNLWLLERPLGVDPVPVRPRWVLVQIEGDRSNQPLIGGPVRLFLNPDSVGVRRKVVVLATANNVIQLWSLDLTPRCPTLQDSLLTPRVCSRYYHSGVYTLLGNMSDNQVAGLTSYTVDLVADAETPSRWYLLKFGGQLTLRTYAMNELFDSATNASTTVPYNALTDPPMRSGAVSAVVRTGGIDRYYLAGGYNLTSKEKFNDVWVAVIRDATVSWTRVVVSEQSSSLSALLPFAARASLNGSFYFYGGANGELVDTSDRTERMLRMISFSNLTNIVRGTPDPSAPEHVRFTRISTQVSSVLSAQQWTGSAMSEATFALPTSSGQSILLGILGGFGSEGYMESSTTAMPAVAIGCGGGEESSDFVSTPCSLCAFGEYAPIPTETEQNTACQPCPTALNTSVIGAADIEQCNACVEGYCLHGGHCSVFGQLATCSCHPGYGGDRCEKRLATTGEIVAAVLATLVAVGAGGFWGVRWLRRPRKYYHGTVSLPLNLDLSVTVSLRKSPQFSSVIELRPKPTWPVASAERCKRARSMV